MGSKWSRVFCIIQGLTVATGGKEHFHSFDLALLEALRAIDWIFLWVSKYGVRRSWRSFSQKSSPLDCVQISFTSEVSSHWGFQSAYYSSVTVFSSLPTCFPLIHHSLTFLSVVLMISDFHFSGQYIVWFYQSSMNVLCPSFHSKTFSTSVFRVFTRRYFLNILTLPLSLVTLTVSELCWPRFL